MDASNDLMAEDRPEAASVDPSPSDIPSEERSETAAADAAGRMPARSVWTTEADDDGSGSDDAEIAWTAGNGPIALSVDASMPETDAFEPDTVEFELALQFQDIGSVGFEGAVRAALGSVGGDVLFDMPLPAEPDCQRVAAVAIGSGGDRLLALVILPAEGSALRVERADRSSNPVAGIVAAYAGVMDHLAIAA
jgi:hypothetical protein